MKIFTQTILCGWLLVVATGCGDDKKNVVQQELRALDELSFPPAGTLIEYEDIEEGRYGLTSVKASMDNLKSKILFELPIKNIGNPATNVDTLTIKTKHIVPPEPGTTRVFSMTVPLSLVVESKDAELIFSESKNAEFQAGTDGEAFWNLVDPKDKTNSSFLGIIFSDFSSLNNKIYRVMQDQGAIVKTDSGFILSIFNSQGEKSITELKYKKL